MDFSTTYRLELQRQLELSWEKASLIPNVFRYPLRIEKERQTSGQFNFLIQLNENRTTLRRPPQRITSVRPAFDPLAFNFNKTKAEEHLFEILFDGHRISFLVNNSPLTRNHCLICPDVHRNSPQVLNEVALEFSLSLLAKLQAKRFRIGFNSPGALASVNHLHLHLVDVDCALFTEDIALRRIYGNWYLFNEPFPSLALVYVARFEDDFRVAAKGIMRIIDYLCDKCIPHNVITTLGEDPEKTTADPCLRTIVFLRDSESLDKSKELSGFNIGIFELAGYVTVGTEEYFNELSEELILERIKLETEMKNRSDFLEKLTEIIKQS